MWGGEKIGLLEDEEVQDILRDRYRLVIDYAKAGSIDMVTDDAEGRDFLFPSNQTALELYKQVHGDPVKSEIILNTPIVLYTRSAVAQALVDSGLAVVTNGVYTVDMEKLTETIEAGTTWEEIGLPQLYGSVSVGTTDPTKSNSGNMFAGFWPIPSAAAWRTKAIWRRSCPGCKIFFRRWGIWKAPPRICSISF